MPNEPVFVNEINPALAFQTIARIAAQIANADVTVTVKEKPAEDTTGEGR